MKKLFIWWHRRREQYHRAREAYGSFSNGGKFHGSYADYHAKRIVELGK